MDAENTMPSWLYYALILTVFISVFGYQSTTIEYSDFETHQYDVIAYYTQDNLAVGQDANGTYHIFNARLSDISQSDKNIIVETYRYKDGWLYNRHKEYTTHSIEMYINSSVIVQRAHNHTIA